MVEGCIIQKIVSREASFFDREDFFPGSPRGTSRPAPVRSPSPFRFPVLPQGVLMQHWTKGLLGSERRSRTRKPGILSWVSSTGGPRFPWVDPPGRILGEEKREGKGLVAYPSPIYNAKQERNTIFHQPTLSACLQPVDIQQQHRGGSQRLSLAFPMVETSTLSVSPGGRKWKRFPIRIGSLTG